MKSVIQLLLNGPLCEDFSLLLFLSDNLSVCLLLDYLLILSIKFIISLLVLCQFFLDDVMPVTQFNHLGLTIFYSRIKYFVLLS
jgi:hypothetical protein